MTTTVTTTVTTVTVLGLGAVLGGILTVALIAFLIGRELTGASDSERARQWRRGSLVAILPLVLSFTLIVGTKVAAIW